MKCSLLLIASTAGLLLLAGQPAHASQISTPVSWTYNFTPSQSFVSANGVGNTGTVSFTNEPTKTASNSSDVVVTNLRVSSTASATSPDTLTNAGWKVGLTLTDSASGATTTMNFGGLLNGSFSASNSNITSTFLTPSTLSWTAPNGTTYSVALTGFTPPGPPTASNAGSISAHVTVTPPLHITGIPEPSTLLLSCLGLGMASLASYRKRRRSLAAMLA